MKQINQYSISRVISLIDINNRLVKDFGVPNGSIHIQCNDGYTGEIYALEWDYSKGTVIVSHDQHLMFSSVMEDGTSSYGDVYNVGEEHISRLIFKCMGKPRPLSLRNKFSIFLADFKVRFNK